MFTFGLPSPQSNVNLGQEIVKMNKQAHELEKKFGTGSTLRRFTKQQKKDAKKEYTALIEEVKKLVGEFGAHKFEAHKKAYDYNLMQEIKTLQTGLEKIARYCRVVPEKETIAQRITRAIIDFFHPKVIVTTACKNEVLEKAIQSIAWNSLSEDIQPYCTYDMPFTTDSFEEEGEWYIEKRDEQKKEIKICKKTAQKEEYITFVITVEKEGRVQVRQKTKRSGVFLQKTETNSYSSWQEIQKKFQLFDKSNISRLFEQKKQFLGSVYQEKPLDKDKNATNTWYIAPEVQSGALSTNFVLHLLDATYAFKINKNYKILFKNELFSSVSALVTHCVGNSRKENIAVKSLYDYETESLQRLKKNIRQQHIELASITKTLQWLNVDEAYVVLKEKDTESRYTLFSIKEGRATQETLWLDEKKNVFIYTSGRKKGRVALVSNIEKAVEATQRLVTQKIQLKLRYVENASFDAIKKKLEHVQKYPHYSRTPCYIIWSDGSSQPDFFVSVRNEGNTISTYPIQCDIWNASWSINSTNSVLHNIPLFSIEQTDRLILPSSLYSLFPALSCDEVEKRHNWYEYINMLREEHNEYSRSYSSLKDTNALIQEMTCIATSSCGIEIEQGHKIIAWHIVSDDHYPHKSVLVQISAERKMQQALSISHQAMGIDDMDTEKQYEFERAISSSSSSNFSSNIIAYKDLYALQEEKIQSAKKNVIAQIDKNGLMQHSPIDKDSIESSLHAIHQLLQKHAQGCAVIALLSEENIVEQTMWHKDIFGQVILSQTERAYSLYYIQHDAATSSRFLAPLAVAADVPAAEDFKKNFRKCIIKPFFGGIMLYQIEKTKVEYSHFFESIDSLIHAYRLVSLQEIKKLYDQKQKKMTALSICIQTVSFEYESIEDPLAYFARKKELLADHINNSFVFWSIKSASSLQNCLHHNIYKCAVYKEGVTYVYSVDIQTQADQYIIELIGQHGTSFTPTLHVDVGTLCQKSENIADWQQELTYDHNKKKALSDIFSQALFGAHAHVQTAYTLQKDCFDVDLRYQDIIADGEEIEIEKPQVFFSNVIQRHGGVKNCHGVYIYDFVHNDAVATQQQRRGGKKVAVYQCDGTESSILQPVYVLDLSKKPGSITAYKESTHEKILFSSVQEMKKKLKLTTHAASFDNIGRFLIEASDKIRQSTLYNKEYHTQEDVISEFLQMTSFFTSAQLHNSWALRGTNGAEPLPYIPSLLQHVSFSSLKNRFSKKEVSIESSKNHRANSYVVTYFQSDTENPNLYTAHEATIRVQIYSYIREHSPVVYEKIKVHGRDDFEYDTIEEAVQYIVHKNHGGSAVKTASTYQAPYYSFRTLCDMRQHITLAHSDISKHPAYNESMTFDDARRYLQEKKSQASIHGVIIIKDREKSQPKKTGCYSKINSSQPAFYEQESQHNQYAIVWCEANGFIGKAVLLIETQLDEKKENSGSYLLKVQHQYLPFMEKRLSFSKIDDAILAIQENVLAEEELKLKYTKPRLIAYTIIQTQLSNYRPSLQNKSVSGQSQTKEDASDHKVTQGKQDSQKTIFSFEEDERSITFDAILQANQNDVFSSVTAQNKARHRIVIWAQQIGGKIKNQNQEELSIDFLSHYNGLVGENKIEKDAQQQAYMILYDVIKRHVYKPDDLSFVCEKLLLCCDPNTNGDEFRPAFNLLCEIKDILQQALPCQVLLQ